MSDDLPDSVFPNNWFSTHRDPVSFPDGLLVTYPMKVPTREREKNGQIISDLFKDYLKRIDIKPEKDEVLEGTGVLIFERKDEEQIIWCSLS